ncbi:type II toxin-antitoxin system RelE/ParE family toxin [Oceaniradius stylonematis]|uniref:type II toxin-antitoxin system RelE/ParE family toxin n=1 Tax=Oceaniradius stylonematis TaxID=2184161 RepID=UPI003C7CD3C9
MIRSIRHKALKAYWTEGKTKGLNAQWLRKLDRIMTALDAAEKPEAMNYPGARFHSLTGDKAGRYSVRLTGNYRVTFAWSDQDAIDVDLEDYH